MLTAALRTDLLAGFKNKALSADTRQIKAESASSCVRKFPPDCCGELASLFVRNKKGASVSIVTSCLAHAFTSPIAC